MLRIYKTSQKKRTDYIYYSADGTKNTITPGEEKYEPKTQGHHQRGQASPGPGVR